VLEHSSSRDDGVAARRGGAMLSIVPFASRYAADALRVILDIQREEFGLSITAEDQPDLLDVPGFYQVCAGEFWLALDGDKVVGTIALKDIGERQAALRKMFVARAARGGGGSGVAARLLETLLGHAGRSGIRSIFLGTTDRFLAAHRFYEKHGFRK